MLHILWLILRVILIILAVVLGILLLCLLLVLFCPVRYRAAASKEQEASLKEAEAEGSVSWLFHALSLTFAFREGALSTSVRIFGISPDRFLHRNRKSSKKNPGGTSAGQKTTGVEPAEPKQIGQKPVEQLSIEPKPEEPKPVEQKTIEPKPAEPKPAVHEQPDRPEKAAAEVPPVKKENPAAKLLRKLTALPGKIRDKYQALRKKSRSTLHKAGWYKDFLLHPKTREAISLLLREAKFLIRHVMPTRVEGDILFGSEDPSITGKVLAFLGVSFPFHRNRIVVTPDFSCENVLAGHVKLKGRIYGAAFAGAAIKILINRSVWNVVRRFRRKEGYANAE